MAFEGRLEGIDPLPGITLVHERFRVPSVDGWSGRSRVVELPGVGTLFVEGVHFRLPERFHMEWRVVGSNK